MTASARHCWRLMLVVSVGRTSPTWGRGTWATAAVSCRHRRRRSAYRRGLNAALYTSGYVECLRWVRGRVPQAYDFVPYMDLPDGWFTKGGNSYCSEHWPMVRR